MAKMLYTTTTIWQHCFTAASRINPLAPGRVWRANFLKDYVSCGRMVKTYIQTHNKLFEFSQSWV